MASRYARLELIYQLIDRPFDSTMADYLLMGVPIITDAAHEFEAWLPLLAGREDSFDQIRGLKQGKSNRITIGKKAYRIDVLDSKHNIAYEIQLTDFGKNFRRRCRS